MVGLGREGDPITEKAYVGADNARELYGHVLHELRSQSRKLCEGERDDEHRGCREKRSVLSGLSRKRRTYEAETVRVRTLPLFLLHHATWMACAYG